MLIERAQRRRAAGYFVRFSQPGFSAAERLGLLDALESRLAPGSQVPRTGQVRQSLEGCTANVQSLRRRVPYCLIETKRRKNEE